MQHTKCAKLIFVFTLLRESDLAQREHEYQFGSLRMLHIQHNQHNEIVQNTLSSNVKRKYQFGRKGTLTVLQEEAARVISFVLPFESHK